MLEELRNELGCEPLLLGTSFHTIQDRLVSILMLEEEKQNTQIEKSWGNLKTKDFFSLPFTASISVNYIIQALYKEAHFSQSNKVSLI